MDNNDDYADNFVKFKLILVKLNIAYNLNDAPKLYTDDSNIIGICWVSIIYVWFVWSKVIHMLGKYALITYVMLLLFNIR